MKIGDWVQTQEDVKTPVAYWPRDLDPNAVGYISSLKAIDSAGEDGVQRDLWNVSFRLDKERVVVLEFYNHELKPADVVSRLAAVSADPPVHTVLDLGKGKILLIQFDLGGVSAEDGHKMMARYRDEVYKVAEKAGIPASRLPLLITGGGVDVKTLDAVELLGLIGKTAE